MIGRRAYKLRNESLSLKETTGLLFDIQEYAEQICVIIKENTEKEKDKSE